MASTLRSFVRDPQDHETWLETTGRAQTETVALADRWRTGGIDAWFTYHLFYKAPDLIGPALCARLGLPYVLAEASLAPRRASGQWSLQHRMVEQAVRTADHVLFLNPADEACVLPALKADAGYSRLPPFLAGSGASAPCDRGPNRPAWASRLGIPADRPWILAVGMMRSGDKLMSYRSLAQSARRLTSASAILILVGDGEARTEVRAAFGGCPLPVVLAGALEDDDLQSLRASADIHAWPAVGEAVGMATLESMAAGLAVVTGRQGAVARVIVDGETGLLAPTAEDMTAALKRLIDMPDLRRTLGMSARRQAATNHGLQAAATHLDRVFRGVMAKR